MTSTLKVLQSQIEITDLASILEVESSSEGLARIALLAHSQDQILHPAFQKLINNQNPDGGFAHLEGWQSNPLDTAFVLIALSETDYLKELDKDSSQEWQLRISNALHYLTTQQHTDGAFRISHLDDLYTSSYVLSALTHYLKDYDQYITIAQSLVKYLESQQTAPATWSTQLQNKGLFLDALVAESLYPYQESNEIESFRSSFNNRVLTLQNSNGSWQNDAYVTSLILNALNSIDTPVANPTTSTVSLTIQDGETNSLLSDVNIVFVSSSGRFESQTDKFGQLIQSDLPAGDYTISVTKPGYVSLNLTAKLITGNQAELGIIKLSRSDVASTSFVQGVVKNVDNDPVAGANVTLYYGDKTIETITNSEGGL